MPDGVALNLGAAFAGAKEGETAVATQEEIERLRKVFDVIDEDGSGTIDTAELKGMLEQLGQRPSDYQVSTMLQLADKDKSGTIDFEEFCMIYGKTVEQDREDSQSELYDCFRVLDNDKSGFIDRNELMKIMCGLGTETFRAPEPSDVDALISQGASPLSKCLIPCPLLASLAEESTFLPCRLFSADLDGDGKINYEEFVKVMLDAKAQPL